MRICEVCKQSFYAKRRDAATCGPTCRWRKNYSYSFRTGRKFDHTYKLPRRKPKK